MSPEKVSLKFHLSVISESAGKVKSFFVLFLSDEAHGYIFFHSHNTSPFRRSHIFAVTAA
jgi:hypothetical protein